MKFPTRTALAEKNKITKRVAEINLYFLYFFEKSKAKDISLWSVQVCAIISVLLTTIN